MKKIFLFIFLLIFFFQLSGGVAWAFCSQDSDCEGGSCQGGECISDVSAQNSQAGSGQSSSGGGSSVGAGIAKQVGQVYGDSGADQRCMTKKECIDIRKKSYDLTDEQAAEGFYSAKEHTDAEKACKSNMDSKGNEIGFCSPVGRADTQISFGGKTSFANLGEFIQYIYKYSILVAAVLSIFMLVIAGVSWTTSAGNSEKTTSAKKKISGALVGLLLALISYNILNLLNPYMVNMRLPQVWILKSQDIVPKMCPQVQSKLSFAYNEAQKKTLTSADIKKKYDSANYATDSKLAQCGSYYFAEGGGNKPCAGSVCGPGKACVYGLNNKLQYECVDAILAGRISASLQFMCSDLTDNIFDNNLMLFAMCPNGRIEKIDDMDLPDSARQYAFPNTLKKNVDSACGGNATGFYLAGEVNDEGGNWFGKKCAGAVASTGCDDWFAIGKSGDNKCDLNLGSLGYKLLNSVDVVDCSGEMGAKNCSCGSISDKSKIIKLSTMPDFTKHLISKTDLSNGYGCDIIINRDRFPSLKNSSDLLGECSADDPTDCLEDQW